MFLGKQLSLFCCIFKHRLVSYVVFTLLSFPIFMYIIWCFFLQLDQADLSFPQASMVETVEVKSYFG